MTAQFLLDYLIDLSEHHDLDTVTVNFRSNNDSDVERVNDVSEDLFDSETNSILDSIMLFGSTEDE